MHKSSAPRRHLLTAMPAFLLEPLENRRLLSAALNTLADLPVTAQQTIVSDLAQDQSTDNAAVGAQAAAALGSWVQEVGMTAADGHANDTFGGSVAISGDTVVVGAANAAIGNHTGQGAAYVFTASGGNWTNITQVAKLTAANGAANDDFGCAVAISGNTVVVGAYYATVGSNSAQGAAYVFTEPGTGWGNMTQTAELTAANGAAGDWFGFTVAIDGNTALVGANQYGNSNRAGAAYIFAEPTTGWANMTQSAQLTAGDSAAGDLFGYSVGISGNTAVIGAPYATVAGKSKQGAAYVFTEPGTGWGNMTQTAKLIASDGAASNGLGISVAISGNNVLAGAGAATIGNNSAQGAAYVFTQPATGWGNMTQTAELTAANGAAGDWFGYAVAIDGNIAVIGAPYASGNQGTAYQFEEPDTGWVTMTQTSKVPVADGVPNAELGSAVAISGNASVLGSLDAAVGNNTDQGAAYVFQNAIVSVTSPGNQTAIAGVSKSFTLGSFTLTGVIGPFDILVSWGDGSPVSTIPVNAAGTIPATAHTYTTSGNEAVTASIYDANDELLDSIGFIVTVNDPTAFSHLSSSSSIIQGTSPVTFSGTIAAGTLIPPSSEVVAITLNGVTQDAAIGSQGNFSATFNTGALRTSQTPYQVSYTYAGDADFSSVTNNTTTKLTVTPGTASIAGTIYADLNDSGAWNANDPELSDVMVYLDTNNNGKLDAGEISVNTDANGNYLFSSLPLGTYTVREMAPGGYVQTYPATSAISVTVSTGQAVAGNTFLDAPSGNATSEAVYRLYSPVTLEHLYTTDPREYNTLESYVGTWNGEGEVFSEYSGSATVGGITDEPFYRLYNPFVLQHLWTSDFNEYTVLATEGWTQEGIVGYVFPAAPGSTATSLPTVPDSAALYRLMAPQVHLWTTDLNEYNTLQTQGWTGEGIIGYVV